MVEPQSELPLAGLRVIDFSQYLSGPFATLRMSDLGASVLKIERPGGDPARRTGRAFLIDGDGYSFHAMNRGKLTLEVDLRDRDERAEILALCERADVLVENFRPGAMERLGLGYAEVRAVNPRIVYGRITGYAADGPWKARPGQDLLIQAVSGMMWLTGAADDPPVAVGLSLVDQAAGHNLVEGIMAALLRAGRTGEGGLVEVSLLESALDQQFEPLLAFLNDPAQVPQRGRVSPAHPFIAAPYGVYQVADGWVAIAHADVHALGKHLGIEALQTIWPPDQWFTHRDEIKAALGAAIADATVEGLVRTLLDGGFWAAPVWTWPELMESAVFTSLDMIQPLQRGDVSLRALRSPIHIDGVALSDVVAAPRRPTREERATTVDAWMKPWR